MSNYEIVLAALMIGAIALIILTWPGNRDLGIWCRIVTTCPSSPPGYDR
jgi:hypothetical protein